MGGMHLGESIQYVITSHFMLPTHLENNYSKKDFYWLVKMYWSVCIESCILGLTTPNYLPKAISFKIQA